jgi:hypothetical protein
MIDPFTLAMLLMAGAGVGSAVLGQVGEYGGRQLKREEIAVGERVGKAEAKATLKLTRESEKRTKEYIERMLRERRTERISERETALMQSFVGSQDRQMALILQAIQGMAQTPYAPQMRQPGGGMVGLLRSNL